MSAFGDYHAVSGAGWAVHWRIAQFDGGGLEVWWADFTGADGKARRVSQRIPAYALFIDPPLGRVGITETEARASGRPLLVGHRPMTRVGRAVEKDETKGFMKVVVDAQTSRILGAAILGTGGDEAIHGLLDVMSAGIPYTALQEAVPIHPTVSELIPTMLGEMRAVS